MRPKLQSFSSRFILSLITILAASTAAHADDVSGKDKLLCAVTDVLLCTEDGDCYPVSVLDADIPQFLVINLKDKEITTTESSTDKRISKISNLIRENGRTFLQGIEDNRAFSILIEDDLGRFSSAVARDGITVSAFGACTDANIK
jgi:hypothetical protein